jgi:hypothetical protein
MQFDIASVCASAAGDLMGLAVIVGVDGPVV